MFKKIKKIKWYKIVIAAVFFFLILVWTIISNLEVLKIALMEETCNLFSFSMTYYDFFTLLHLSEWGAIFILLIWEIWKLIGKWIEKDLEENKDE